MSKGEAQSDGGNGLKRADTLGQVKLETTLFTVHPNGELVIGCPKCLSTTTVKFELEALAALLEGMATGLRSAAMVEKKN